MLQKKKRLGRTRDISCQKFFLEAKLESWSFTNSPSTNDFDDSPYRYDTPKFRCIFVKRCVIGLVKITYNLCLKKKITGGCNHLLRRTRVKNNRLWLHVWTLLKWFIVIFFCEKIIFFHSIHLVLGNSCWINIDWSHQFQYSLIFGYV